MAKLRPFHLCLLSGLLGFLLTALFCPKWMEGVESGAILSEDYRNTLSPTWIYHTQIYSLLLIQLPAVALKAGFSPWGISLFFSGLQGFLCFFSFSLLGFLFTRNRLFLLVAPFILLQFPAIDLFHYPIFLPASPYVYGHTGMFFALMSLACLAAHYDRLGFFLLGFLPAVHPSFPLFTWVGAGVYFALDPVGFGGRCRRNVAYFALGFFLFALSLGWQLYAFRLPSVDAAQAAALLAEFEGAWNYHRIPLDFRQLWVPLFFLCSLPVLVWRAPVRGRSFLLVNAALVFLTLMLVSPARVSFFPEPLRIWSAVFLPSRWLNMALLVFPLATLGLVFRVWWRRPSALGSALLFFCFVWIFLFDLAVDGHPLGRYLWPAPFRTGEATRYFFRALPIFVPGLVFLGWNGRWGRPRPELKRGVRLLLLGLLLFLPLLSIFRLSESRAAKEDSASLAFLGGEKGAVLLGPEAPLFFHAKTGRMPIVDTMALDQARYSAKIILPLESALLEIYGVSLKEKPAEQRQAYRTLGDFGPRIRGLWEDRSPEAWRALAEKFGFCEILVPDAWSLRLSRPAGLTRDPADRWSVYTVCPN